MRLARCLQFWFFFCIIRPLAYIILGLNIRHADRLNLCLTGPSILVANHNSHLDTIVLMSLFPLKNLPRLRPVGAIDYFARNRYLYAFATHIMGILPVHRHTPDARKEFYKHVDAALDNDEVLILYPEGTRGSPEQMGELKRGIAYIAQAHPNVPVVPIFLQGLGKSLPKGEGLFVPFFCDVSVGEGQYWSENQNVENFLETLKDNLEKLAKECPPSSWD